MSGLPLEPRNGGGRFPGFDVLAQARHWDGATASAVLGRMGMLPAVRFFTREEEATAAALLDQILYQREEPRVPIVQLVDSRLAEEQTDGWHFDTMPPDDLAWRDSLAGLDADAVSARGRGFADCEWDEQHEILGVVHDHGEATWRGMPANHVWDLWTRYACVAFYSHPLAWNEIGFAGPAYPRGYKNLGVGKREPFEVADARSEDDPLAGRS